MDIEEFRNQVNKLFVECKEKNIEYMSINKTDLNYCETICIKELWEQEEKR